MSGVWDEWKATTRFLESTRIAFERERLLWSSLQIDPQGVLLQVPSRHGRYQIALTEHLEVINTETSLLSAVLIQSYALTESAAADAGIDTQNSAGIEDWGNRLLATNGRKWKDVLDGKTGAVEVGIVRNAYAHSSPFYSSKATNRMLNAGGQPFPEGDPIVLDYERVSTFRDRLKALLRQSAIR